MASSEEKPTLMKSLFGIAVGVSCVVVAILIFNTLGGGNLLGVVTFVLGIVQFAISIPMLRNAIRARSSK